MQSTYFSGLYSSGLYSTITSLLRGAHNCDDTVKHMVIISLQLLQWMYVFYFGPFKHRVKDSECINSQITLKCICVWSLVTVLYHIISKDISLDHFWVHLSLSFKASLSAKSLLWLSVWIHIEIRPNYRSKNFTLKLPLKERLRRTLKWPTYHGCCVALNLSHQLTGHGLRQAPRICSISHKNARKKNSPQSNRKTKKTKKKSILRTWYYREYLWINK